MGRTHQLCSSGRYVGTCFSKNRKARALACHKNAIKEDAGRILYSFIKREELFWEIVY